MAADADYPEGFVVPFDAWHFHRRVYERYFGLRLPYGAGGLDWPRRDALAGRLRSHRAARYGRGAAPAGPASPAAKGAAPETVMAADLCRRCAAAAVVAIAMCVSAGALADFLTGNDLYAACTSGAAVSPIRLGRVFCNGYVAAISDASRRPNSVDGFSSCPGGEITLGQAVDVVGQFLAENPAVRQSGARKLTAAALAKAFPCR